MEEVNYMTTRLYPWHKLPQFWELASKKWKQSEPGTEAWPPKTTKRTLVRWTMTNLKTTVRADCAASACSSLPLPESSGPTGYQWRGVGLWTDRCSPSPPPVASIWHKVNFPFHQLDLFIGFWAVSSWTPLWATEWSAMSFNLCRHQTKT